MLINQNNRLLPFAARSMAAILLAGMSTVALSAQPVSAGADSDSDASSAAPLTMASSSPAVLDLATVAGVGYSSSVTPANGPDAVDAERLNLTNLDSTQPPPRRRYGTPRYNDSSHNADGSNKYGFLVGAGLTLPNGNTHHYYNTGYAFQVGGGRNFNKNFSVMLQFDYDHFGLNGLTLANQTTVYNYGVPAVYQISGLDGNMHDWSFTLNPSYNFYHSEGLGAYVVAGVGFYHKVTNFTLPETGTAYDPYYGYYSYSANEVVDHYSANAPGFSGGFGLTYKPSRFAGERLYVEARYVFVDNQHRTGQSINNITDVTTYNQFPANSNRTSYVPVKAGIRF